MYAVLSCLLLLIMIMYNRKNLKTDESQAERADFESLYSNADLF